MKYLQLNKALSLSRNITTFQNAIARSVHLIPSFLARFANLNPFSYRTRRGFPSIGGETAHKLFRGSIIARVRRIRQAVQRLRLTLFC